jgi:hypothetical protein
MTFHGPAPDRLGAPEDRGWAQWEQVQLTGSRHSALRLVPRDGHCSLASCERTAVAAVQRGSSGTRPGYWQPYCDVHAYARGVFCTPGGLAWTTEYLVATGHVDPRPT